MQGQAWVLAELQVYLLAEVLLIAQLRAFVAEVAQCLAEEFELEVRLDRQDCLDEPNALDADLEVLLVEAELEKVVARLGEHWRRGVVL